MNFLVVTAGIIRNERKILLAQRKSGSHLEFQWEFPGGKMEKGEIPEACLQRELREELGIEVAVKDIFTVISHQYEDRQILLLTYLCDYQEGKVQAKDCEDFCWIGLEELGNFPLTQADLPIAKKINMVGEKIFLMDSLVF